MTPAMMAATRAETLLQRIHDRLVAKGAVESLNALAGLSASEVDVLLRLEREAS
jgi:hypothetical protein